MHRGNVAQDSIWKHTHTHTQSFALRDTPKPPWSYFSLSREGPVVKNAIWWFRTLRSHPKMWQMTHLVTHPSLFFLPFLLFSILLCLMQCKVHWFQPQMFMFICCFYCNTDTKDSWQKMDESHTNANISPLLYILLETPHKSFPSIYRLFILKSFIKSSFLQSLYYQNNWTCK